MPTWRCMAATSSRACSGSDRSPMLRKGRGVIGSACPLFEPKERMLRLDPDAERVLELFRTNGRPSVTTLTPGEAREVYRVSCQRLGPEPPAVAHVRDLIARGPGHDIPRKDCAGDRCPRSYSCTEVASASATATRTTPYVASLRTRVTALSYRSSIGSLPSTSFRRRSRIAPARSGGSKSTRPLSQSTASVSRWAGIVREETWPPSYRIWRATARYRQFVFSFCFIRALR